MKVKRRYLDEDGRTMIEYDTWVYDNKSGGFYGTESRSFRTGICQSIPLEFFLKEHGYLSRPKKKSGFEIRKIEFKCEYDLARWEVREAADKLPLN